MRTHLYSNHKDLYEPDILLHSSQLNRIKRKRSAEIDNDKKKEIDNAILDAIIIDGRPHGDFSKNGMKKFLEIGIPGYKPPCRSTIKSRLKTKYNFYFYLIYHIFF